MSTVDTSTVDVSAETLSLLEEIISPTVETPTLPMPENPSVAAIAATESVPTPVEDRNVADDVKQTFYQVREDMGLALVVKNGPCGFFQVVKRDTVRGRKGNIVLTLRDVKDGSLSSVDLRLHGPDVIVSHLVRKMDKV